MYVYMMLIEMICLALAGDQNGKADPEGVLNGSWVMYVCTGCMKCLVLLLTLYNMSVFAKENQKNREKNKQEKETK